jgi:hypothetical protein
MVLRLLVELRKRPVQPSRCAIQSLFRVYAVPDIFERRKKQVFNLQVTRRARTIHGRIVGRY